jgi:hypothetical protein
MGPELDPGRTLLILVRFLFCGGMNLGTRLSVPVSVPLLLVIYQTQNRNFEHLITALSGLPTRTRPMKIALMQWDLSLNTGSGFSK